jgi:serine/threonine protein kinase
MSRKITPLMVLVPTMCATGDPFAFIADATPYDSAPSDIDGGFVADVSDDSDIFSDCVSFVLDGTCPDNESLYWRWEDLEVLELIGYGSYGRVHRARHRPSGQITALKFVDKPKLAMSKSFAHHHAMERRILPLVSRSRFVAHCLGILETGHHVIFVEEFVPGGELYYHLQQRKDGAFPESQVRFYSAEVVCMLRDLHDMNVVYRDLKPENLMLDHRGHLKLVDFGLATVLEPNHHPHSPNGCLAGTYCGTAEYIAPEVLRGQAYGAAVDIWGLGCVIYEMLTGYPPFYSENQNSMFAKILAEPLKIPKEASDDLRRLLQLLLNKDWRKRPTLEAIQQHAWFRGLDWFQVQGQRLPPPIVPTGQETLRQATMPDNVRYAREHCCGSHDGDDNARILEGLERLHLINSHHNNESTSSLGSNL